MEDDFGADEVAVKPFVFAGAGANGLWADVDGAPKTLVGGPPEEATERATGNPEGCPKIPDELVAAEVCGASPNGFGNLLGASNEFTEGAKGLKGAGAGDPNDEDVSVVFATKGFIVTEDSAMVDWFGFGSLRLSANRTCLLLWNPRPLPPLPLTIMLFCPLCARFAAFSSRS
jgi:hypothetical protein